MKKLTTLLIVSLLTIASYSQFSPIPEPNSKLSFSSVENLLNKEHVMAIEDLYNSGTEGSITGKKNVAIYYKYFIRKNNEKGAVLISSGRTEAALKYKELIFDLFNNGYSVYIFDHRGQGLSGRMTETHDMGYVSDFQFYIDDMKSIYTEVILKGNHEKIYLLSHSLGGQVAMSYLEQHPRDFNAASFCSPMLGFTSYICPLAKILNSKTPKYAPGQTDYHNDSTAFEGNDVSYCKERYYRKIAENNLHPESVLGGASVQWLAESCKHIKSTFKNIDNIEIPIIIFLAEDESVVNPKATEKFIKKAQKAGVNCEGYIIKNAMHEILVEKDQARRELLSTTLMFYSQY